jgi:hypothetical protein
MQPQIQRRFYLFADSTHNFSLRIEIISALGLENNISRFRAINNLINLRKHLFIYFENGKKDKINSL